MKKTNYIFKIIIAMIAIVTFTSCSKEIGQPQSTAAKASNTSGIIKTKPFIPWPDSVTTHK